MTDIITRLRGPVPSMPVMLDAADEIARLREDYASSQERVMALEEALSSCQTVAIMRGDQYLSDCIDNSGKRYQSAWLAALLEKP